MERKIKKIVTDESSSITNVTRELNKSIEEYKYWYSDIKFDVNEATGYYYFVHTVYQDLRD